MMDRFFKQNLAAAGRHLAARMDLAAGQRARPHALAGDAARIPARRADPRRFLPDRRQHAVDHARRDAAAGRGRRQRPVKLDINGTVVESKAGSNAPVAVPWPGAGPIAPPSRSVRTRPRNRRRSSARDWLRRSRLRRCQRRRRSPRCSSAAARGRCSACSTPDRRRGRATGSSRASSSAGRDLQYQFARRLGAAIR